MSDSLDLTAKDGGLDAREVAKVRHDLRNPLGHIMGFSELLLERARQQRRTEAVPGLQELVSSSEQILDEINHALELRRLEAGQVNLNALQRELQRFCRRAVFLGRQAENQMGGGEKVAEDVRRITDSAERMEALGNDLVPALQDRIPVAAQPSVEPPQPPISAGGSQELIGLQLFSGQDQGQLSTTFRQAGYRVQLLPLNRSNPASPSELGLDALVIELDLEGEQDVGFLEKLKSSATPLPVMVLSRSPSEAGVRRALKAGAQDVVRYPLQPELLLARMGSLLAIKRLHDQERTLLRRIATEQQRVDRMIQILLPSPIAARLRRGERFIADLYADTCVLAADFGGLSRWAATFAPEAVVRGLNEVFAAYDKLCERFGVPVGRVTGDGYQVVVGLPEPVSTPVEIAAELALAMQREALPLRLAGGRLLRVRIGLHGGAVSAGVLGGDRLSFDLWGETVDLARALRAQAPAGGILMSAPAAAELVGQYVFERSLSVRLDETKEFETRLLLGKVPAMLAGE